MGFFLNNVIFTNQKISKYIMENIKVIYNPLTKLLTINNELIDKDYVKYINAKEPLLIKNKIFPNSDCCGVDISVSIVGKNVLFVKSRKETGMRIFYPRQIESYLKWRGLEDSTIRIDCTLLELQQYIKEKVLDNMDEASKDIIAGLKQELTKAHNENWDAQERARIRKELASTGYEF